MANYHFHDYLVHGLLLLSFLAQLVPGLYGLRICRMTGWVRYWSTSWIVFTAIMFWIMLRRGVVFYTYDYRCDLTVAWLFDQVISTLITSAGLTIVAVLKFKFYNYWLEASVIRIDSKKKVIANDRMHKERTQIKTEQAAVEKAEKVARDTGPE